MWLFSSMSQDVPDNVIVRRVIIILFVNLVVAKYPIATPALHCIAYWIMHIFLRFLFSLPFRPALLIFLLTSSLFLALSHASPPTTIFLFIPFASGYVASSSKFVAFHLFMLTLFISLPFLHLHYFSRFRGISNCFFSSDSN